MNGHHHFIILVVLSLSLSACGGVDSRSPDGLPGTRDGSPFEPSADGGTAVVETCDTYDEDGDGLVDEGCVCASGDRQPCHPWASADEEPCARAGVQTCDGSEFGQWGECVIEPAPVTEFCPWWILGAAPGDAFNIGLAGFGDLAGDGTLDLVGTSVNAKVDESSEAGVAYALYGGADRVGTLTDLALTSLDGTNGFRVEGISMWFAARTRPTQESAWIADLNGDGISDLVTTTRGRSLLAIFGRPTHRALYSQAMADGIVASMLTGAVGTHGVTNLLAGDIDGDGYAEVFSAGSNFSLAGSTHEGLALWNGRASWGDSVERDRMITIGVEAIGQGSLGNFADLGGLADFDADGFLDLTASNGASNDTILRTYRAHSYYGGLEGLRVTDMLSFAERDGTTVTGGSGRGTVSNHQYGDFDGDGIDDLFVNGADDGFLGSDGYILYGHAGARPHDAAVTPDLAPDIGLAFPISWGMRLNGRGRAVGFGDIDGDGLDDLVAAAPRDGQPEILIVWGCRDRTGGALAPVTRLSIAALAVSGGVDPSAIGEAFTAAVADIDGDGLGDIIIGLARADTRNGEDSGAGVVVFGRELYAHHNASLRRLGGGADTVDVSAAVQTVATGRGHDTITGIGASDVIYAGEGDDVLELSGGDFGRLHGGLGTDTVVLSSSVLTLDLRTMGRARVQEIERFDLTADGPQQVAFNQGDVSALSSTTRTFEVIGGGDDSLVLEGAWTEEAPGTYVVGALRVRTTGVTVEVVAAR